MLMTTELSIKKKSKHIFCIEKEFFVVKSLLDYRYVIYFLWFFDFAIQLQNSQLREFVLFLHEWVDKSFVNQTICIIRRFVVDQEQL